MKKQIFLPILAAVTLGMAAFTPATTKYVAEKTNITFFSSTPAEDISAKNVQAVSTIDVSTGKVVFSVPMQGFEFEKSMMQKHFNGKDFLNTSEFPKAKLTGTITNLGDINFEKDGTYDATVQGELTIKDKAKEYTTKGSVTVKGSSIEVNSKFNVTLADHGITFVKGKPSSNIAKTVEVSVNATYKAE